MSQMDLFRKLFRQPLFEYLVLLSSLAIVETSANVGRFAEDPTTVTLGGDARQAFPELIGLEATLAAIVREEISGFELEGLLRENREVYFDLHIVSIELESGDRGLLIYLQDTTEKMQMRQELVQAANEAQLLLTALSAAKAYTDCVVDSMVDALIVTSASGRIEIVNRAAMTLLGRPESELTGQNLDALLPRQNLLARVAALQNSPTGARIANLETQYERPNGQELCIAFSCAHLNPADFPQSRFLPYIGSLVFVGRDITPIKQMMADLEAARQKAEAADRAKSEFLAVMSHEIRTPMNAIVGMTGLLVESELQEEQREWAEIVRNSGNALLSLIEDILDLSKISAGKLELLNMEFSLRDCVEGVVNSFRYVAKSRGLELGLTLAPDLPALVTGDGKRLRQILTNLVGNAMKFTATGSVQVTVDWTPLPEPNQVELRFAVADTGIGIAPDRMARLFQPFTQADAAIAAKYGGTGLGLAICDRLCQLLGGQIWAESQGAVGGNPPVDFVPTVDTVGSTFWFTVQMGTVPLGVVPASIAVPSLLTPASPRESLRILVAEDNPVNQRVMAHILRKLGYSADFVATGQEVLAQLEQTTYDVVLMDVQMPGMDGLTTARRIREIWGDRPKIIAVTAEAMVGDREKCLQAGMDGYLSKPFRLEELVAVLLLAQQ
ncbi:MAG: response regulator [Pseudanabaenaceae cyanobacterium]